MQNRRAHGTFAIPELLDQFKQARETHASLLDCEPENVAFFQTCASAISQVALGIKWEVGDEVILWDQEYPSNAYPWFEASRRHGCEVKVLQSESDFSVPTEKLVEQISDKTRVVTISWVQYQTGAMSDLKALSEACKMHDAWLVVDAIQGLGVIPFSMRDIEIDAVCGGGHKWLLGVIGHGFLALKSERHDELEPLLHGAVTYGTPEDRPEIDLLPKEGVGRYEPGIMHLQGAIGTAASIQVLQSTGIDAVNKHACNIANILRSELPKIGANVFPGGKMCPIVTFVPDEEVTTVSQRLLSHSVSHAAGRAGGIRLAPHGFSTEQDCERVFEAVRGA